MPADPSVYASPRLALAYARHRPAVHAQVCAQIRQAALGSPPRRRFAAALDAGCGAGASTAALLPHATRVWGVDPFEAMLAQARVVVPAAEFSLGRLDALPFGAARFELVASAGAINYTAPPPALAELARVLQPGGWLALYDFADGRPVGAAAGAQDPVARMRALYPSGGGYALDLAALPLAEAGLQFVDHRRWTVQLPMSAAAYLDYMMGDTGIERAIAGGADEAAVRAACQALFAPDFRRDTQPVGFAVELLLARRAPGAAPAG